MKSNCILCQLYHLLSLLQPFPTKVCHVLMTLMLVMDVQIMSSLNQLNYQYKVKK